MIAITLVVSFYLAYVGYSYYATALEERFYHPQHDWFKPSGLFGHGLGIIGTFMILFGVVIYIARKRYNFMGRYLRLKYLLEFHIFLCTLGPILVLFHTAFKFGGIVSIAFWSMVAVVLSGVIGRFIYIQIPRTIEGRALSLTEVQLMKGELTQALKAHSDKVEPLKIAVEQLHHSSDYKEKKQAYRSLKKALKTHHVSKKERKEMLSMARQEMALSARIARLERMQQLFKYWHVAHLPFALIMLVIVVIHVGVTLAFGYTWIF